MNSCKHPFLRRFLSMPLALCLLLASLLCASPSALAASHPVRPAAALPVALPVQVFGRAIAAPDRMYTYQWPGVYFLAAFQAKAVYFHTGAGRQRLQINVDGQISTLLTPASPARYRFATPGPGTHLLRIDVLNENQDQPKSLGSFTLAPGGRPLGLAPKARQIEFIGDSHTVGYANTSLTRECTEEQVWSTTDAYQSYGAEVARHYAADYQINAISGRGVVRNYDGFVADPLPVAYPFLFHNHQTSYQNPTWKPSVVAVNLGTNDLMTALHETETWKSRDELHAAYRAGYVDFVQSLRQRYPDALILMWTTDIASGEVATEAAKVAQQLRDSGDTHLEFVAIPGLSFASCNWHPSTADDRVVANKLIEIIDTHKELWPPDSAPELLSEPATTHP